MQSMTGFGFATGEVKDYNVEVYIKGLNSKNLDINVRLSVPNVLLEFSIRELVKEFIKRGQVQVSLNLIRKDDAIPEFESIEKSVKLAKQLVQSLGLNVSDDSILELAFKLHGPREQVIGDELIEPIRDIVKTALGDFIKSRQNEGRALTKDIIQRLFTIKNILNEVNSLKEELYEQQKTKLLERMAELKIEDSNLKAGELLILISRMDIEEEITRLFSHIEQSLSLLNSQESARKLEFLIQEMHREINTMTTKMPALSNYAVEVKTQLERIRQQLANLE